MSELPARMTEDYMHEAERLISEVVNHYDDDAFGAGVYMALDMKVQIAQVYATLSMTSALLGEGDEDEVSGNVEFGTPPSGGEDRVLPEEMRLASEITLEEFIGAIAHDSNVDASFADIERLRGIARASITEHIEQAGGA